MAEMEASETADLRLGKAAQETAIENITLPEVHRALYASNGFMVRQTSVRIGRIGPSAVNLRLRRRKLIGHARCGLTVRSC